MSAEDESADAEKVAGQLQELDRLRTSLTQSDRLLHELRIHQIELEIQNRALREAQEQLEGSRYRYVELFESAPMAYLTLEPDGRIVEVNVAAARLLGLDRLALVGRRLQAVVGLTDPLSFRAVLRVCAERRQEGRTEIAFRTVTQQTHTVEVVLVPVLGPEGLGHVRVALHDVTARAAAEENLRFLSQAGARLSRIPLGSSQLLDEIAGAGAFGVVEGCWAELEGLETAAWRSEPIRRKLNADALDILRTQIAPAIENVLV